MCVLGVNPGEGQKQKGYRSGERGRHKADPVITEVVLVVRLTLNPHTQHRRMRHPGVATAQVRNTILTVVLVRVAIPRTPRLLFQDV